MAYNTGAGLAGTSGNLYGTNRITSDIFKGGGMFEGTDYFDTADNGKPAYARYADVLGGNQNFKNYVQNKYPQMWELFGAASGDDPSMTWTKFLTNNQDQMVSDYSEMTPSQRGEQPGRSLGRLRWL